MKSVYDFIVKYISENGYPPSVRDICRGLEFRSTSTVAGHLNNLEKSGLIQIDRHISRGIKVIK